MVDALHHIQYDCPSGSYEVDGKTVPTLDVLIGSFRADQELIPIKNEDRTRAYAAAKKGYCTAICKKGFAKLLADPLGDPHDIYQSMDRVIHEGSITDIAPKRIEEYHRLLLHYAHLDRCKPIYFTMLKDISRDLLEAQFESAAVHRDALTRILDFYEENRDVTLVHPEVFYCTLLELKENAINQTLKLARESPTKKKEQEYRSRVERIIEFNILAHTGAPNFNMEDTPQQYDWAKKALQTISESLKP